MNVHDIDIELPPLPKASKMYDIPGYDEEELKDYARAAIEADRKRRRSEAEEVCAEAYQVVGNLLSDLGIFETDHAKKILDNLSQAKKVHKDVLPWPSFERKHRGEPVGYVSPSAIKRLKAGGNAIIGGMIQGFDVPIYTAPQPAESCESLISDKPACGSENGKCDSQPAEPVKVRPETTSEHIARDIREGRFPNKSERQMIPAEPVKVPSDEDILELWSGDPTHSRPVMGKNKVLAFARAILARYTAPQPAEPCASSVSDKTACGSENGDCDSQPVDPDSAKCAECGAELIPVRPGKWQHPDCSQSSWASEPVAWPLASPGMPIKDGHLITASSSKWSALPVSVQITQPVWKQRSRC